MNKNNFKKIVKQAQRLALTPQEKNEMKSSLFRHIEANPSKAGVVWYETPKFFSMTFLGRSIERLLVPALVCVLIVGASASTFASKTSLPGDILYPVKILNERIESGLTFDSTSLAQIEEKHAITRLVEAETLSIKSKLDAETKIKLINSFNRSSENTIERIGRLYEKDKEKAKKAFGSFKASVNAQKDVLKNISGRDDDFVESLSPSTQSLAATLGSSTTDDVIKNIGNTSQDGEAKDLAEDLKDL